MKSRSTARFRPSTLAAAAGTILALSGAAHAQFNWASAVSGNWNDGTKWSPAGFPSGADNALINVAGAYSVNIPNATTQQVSNLTVGNASATITLPDNCTFQLNGSSHTNNGLIRIQTANVGNLTRILFASSATMSGSGTISLEGVGNGDNDSAYLTYSGVTSVLTHGPSHTISGRGHIYTPIANQGLIDANQSAKVLRLQDQPKSNSGTMRASSGGTLIVNSALTQTGGGLLEAQTGSAVVLQSASVSGGNLMSSGTGAIINTNSQTSSVDGVTVTGGSLLQLNDNSSVNVSSGGITNNGLITIQNIGGAGNLTRIQATAPFTFSGTGTVRLQGVGSGDNDSAYLTYSAAANTITSVATHTIAGDGRIYAGLINAGLVDADQNGKVLRLTDQPKSNTGTMRATNGGGLYLNCALTQSGAGLLQAQNNAVVLLISSSVTGGTMSSSGTGAIINNNSQQSSLDGVTLSPGSLLQCNDNSTLNVGGGGLTNNALVTVQNIGGAGNPTRISAAAGAVALNGSGNVRLQATGNFNDSAYLYYTATPNVLTNTAAHTISGVGRIYTNLVNNGTVLADSNAANRIVMQLLEQPKANNNLMKATAGGQIYLTNTTVTQAPTATIQADATSAVVLQGATVNSGRFTTTGDGVIVNLNSQTSIVDGVTLTTGSVMQLNDNSTLRARNSLTNNGTIFVENIGGAGNTTRIMCDSPAITLTGTGTIRLQAVGNFNDSAYLYHNAFGSPAVPGVFTNASGHTIAGVGRIYNGIVNNGTIVADSGVAGRQVMQLLDQPKTNNSLMRATGGGQIYISNTSVSQGASGQMVADTGSAIVLQSCGVTGGTLTSSGTGAFVNLNSQASSIDAVTLASGSLLQCNDNSTLNLGTGGMVNNGTITIQNIGGAGNATRLTAPSNALISGIGMVRLQAVNFNNDSAYLWGQGDGAHPLTLGSGQTVSGTGRFYGNIVSQGKITPDQPFGTPSSIGLINIPSGSLTMAPTSSYDVQIASTASFDRITGGATIAQAGALAVVAKGAYVPAGPDMFDIVTAASITGKFNPVTLPPTGSFGPAHVVYLPTVTRVVMCYANCDGSNVAPVLNVGDFSCFLNAFAAGDPYANCDGSTTPPVLNVQDFSCYLNKFAAGCP